MSSAPLPLSLFATGDPHVVPGARVARTTLDDECWYDVAPGWLAGGDQLLATLVGALPWHQGRRVMWGRLVDEPRLSCGVDLEGTVAPPVVPAMAAALSACYGVTFDSCWCNYYRDGHDSVAWHADREGHRQRHPLVAIASLGGPRVFALRPKGGGHAWHVTLHSGDLLVMGGALQHHFEHAVPKVHRAPPRLSVTFRHSHPAAPRSR